MRKFIKYLVLGSILVSSLFIPELAQEIKAETLSIESKHIGDKYNIEVGIVNVYPAVSKGSRDSAVILKVRNSTETPMMDVRLNIRNNRLDKVIGSTTLEAIPANTGSDGAMYAAVIRCKRKELFIDELSVEVPEESAALVYSDKVQENLGVSAMDYPCGDLEIKYGKRKKNRIPFFVYVPSVALGPKMAKVTFLAITDGYLLDYKIKHVYVAPDDMGYKKKKYRNVINGNKMTHKLANLEYIIEPGFYLVKK